MINIAIDGPSGAGKSSCAKLLAKKLGYIYVDTGALYRSVGLYAFENQIAPDDSSAVVAFLPKLNLDIRYIDGEQRVVLCGRDVSDAIRRNEISMYASRVSAIPEVRAFLLETQRNLAKTQNVIMDGRDIGTVILPNADLKIFLTASAESRAQRRFDELTARGESVCYDEILTQIIERDQNDRERSIAPAVPAADAVVLDNSDLNLEQTVTAIENMLKEKLQNSKKDMPSSFYRRIYAVFAKVIRFLWRVHPHDTANIPENGACLMCINHTAFSDVLVVAAASSRQVHYLAKAELFKIPLLGSLIRALGAFPIRRGASDVQAIKTTLALLKEGKMIGIFPQGTRHPGVDPSLTDVKSGVGMLAHRSKATVVPVFISTKKYRTRIFHRTDVYFGKPITPDELAVEKGNAAQYTAISQKIFGAICQMDPHRQTSEN